MSQPQSCSSHSRYGLRDFSTAQGAGAAGPPTNAPAASAGQSDTININWVFFGPSTDYIDPTALDLTKKQFIRPSTHTRSTFATAISTEWGLEVKLSDIKFWTPIERVSVRDAIGREWGRKLRNLEEHFVAIPRATPFADIFVDEIKDRQCLHLIVTTRQISEQDTIVDDHEETQDSVGELPPQRLLKATLADKGPSPSEGSKSRAYASIQSKPTQAIFDGRYTINAGRTIAPPVEIFHPIFNKFRYRLHNTAPSREVLIKVQQFMAIASQIHPGEVQYAKKLRSTLSDILGLPVTLEGNNNATISDGVVSFTWGSFRFSIFIMEVKREWGEGGSDASTQGGLSMKRVWSDDKNETFEILAKCCSPTFILAGGGPWLGVLGGVFTDKVIVQRLTDMMWIGQSSTYEDPRAYRFAQMMVALRESLVEMKDYYTKLLSDDIPGFQPNVPHPRFFPYPTSYKVDHHTVRWSYVRALESDSTCVTYLAKIEESSELVVVKFVDRYGQEAHRFLADKGHAPKLRYCGPLEPPQPTASLLPAQAAVPGISLGPLQMVVMDYVEAHSPADVKSPIPMRLQLTDMLVNMHKAGYVFGDLRKPNVILHESGKVQLIDFDWAGRCDRTIQDELLDTDAPDLIPDDVLQAFQMGQNSADNVGFAAYPLDISKSVFANTGADDLLPIRPVHDWRMLRMLTLPDEPKDL